MQSSTIVKIRKLSPREQEVADLIIKGISTNDISKKLNIKPNTVSTLKRKIFIKLGVESNVELYKLFLNS
jgi:DNA-binding CsgD family transcriptional regulator